MPRLRSTAHISSRYCGLKLALTSSLLSGVVNGRADLAAPMIAAVLAIGLTVGLVNGALILLRDQDRSSWNRVLIEEGHEIVRACLRRNRPGPYQIQAAINAVHADAEFFEATDWSQILGLYDQLLAMQPLPVVLLNLRNLLVLLLLGWLLLEHAPASARSVVPWLVVRRPQVAR